MHAALGGMRMEVGVAVLPAALERVSAQLHGLAAIASQVRQARGDHAVH